MNLENKIPPPIIALLFIVLIYLSTFVVRPIYFKAQSIIAIILFILGLTIMGLAVRQFKHAGTTIDPLKPETAGSLVATGPFKYSRNPMYLGMAIIILCTGIFWGAYITIIALPLFVVYLNHFQIIPEERAMTKIFPEQYVDYCAKVRRWI